MNKNTILYALAIFLFGSCSTAHYMRTDAVIPPKLSIPEDTKTILFMDRSIERNPAKKIVTAIITKSIGDEYSSGKNILISDFMGVLPNSIVSGRSKLKDKAGNEDTPADLLTADKITEFGSGYEGLLCLEQFYIDENREFLQKEQVQLDKNSKEYTVKVIEGTRTTRLTTHWRLYDVTSGVVLLNIPYVYGDKTTAIALDKEIAANKLDTANLMTVEVLAKKAADMLVADFSPKEFRSAWIYYKKGSDAIKQSAKWIKVENFDRAITTLETSLETTLKPKVEERTLYNLAVAYMLHGNKDKALNKASDGYAISGDRMLKNLIRQINESN